MYEQNGLLPEVMILGIPVDNLTLKTATQRILTLINNYQTDKQARQVVTVNVDFLVNALNWRVSEPPRHPELIEVLRNADLVTADGMPIVWLSRLLKTPLQERVTGADLLPNLARTFTKTGHSMYFLGGKGDVAQQAALKLKGLYSELDIAGVYSPFVYAEGEDMLISEQEDEEIIKRINQAKPDVLLIGFGNPKQELWFNRNRHKIQVPVTIGIGGTFEFIVGNVKRSPVWMQKIGMEWIYRIIQDPKRLWKRYMIGMAKISILAIPLIINDRLHRNRHQSLVHDNNNYPSGVNSRNTNYEFVIRLSKRMDAQSMKLLLEQWEEHALQHKQVVFNFIDVKFIDSNAIGMLVRFYKRLQKANVSVLSKGLVNPEVEALLKLTRVWDLFNQNHEVSTMNDYTNDAQQLIVVKDKSNTQTNASLIGRLDASALADMDFNEMINKLGQGDYNFDLSQLTFIDSTGLRLFFYLQRDLKKRNKKLSLINPNRLVLQLLEVTKLTGYFNVKVVDGH